MCMSDSDFNFLDPIPIPYVVPKVVIYMFADPPVQTFLEEIIPETLFSIISNRLSTLKCVFCTHYEIGPNLA